MNSKDHDKAGLVSLYQKLPHALTQGKIKYGSWLKESYSRKDYVDLKKKISDLKTEDQRSDHLMKHPEELAFLSYGRSFFDGNALPELGYKTVSYVHPKKGPVSFADCMDSSILNFLGITLRDPKTSLFSVAPIQSQLAKNHLKTNPELDKFIHQHPEVNSLDSLDAHKAWVPLVQRLQYVNGDYEMDTTLGNLFRVMEHLVFQSSGQGQAGSKTSSLTDPKKSNSQKMNVLCELLTRDDFELEWEVLGGKKEDLDKKNTGVTLRFKIEGEPAFDWSITSGHSEILRNPIFIPNNFSIAL